jgi:hypothetical protein
MAKYVVENYDYNYVINSPGMRFKRFLYKNIKKITTKKIQK